MENPFIDQKEVLAKQKQQEERQAKERLLQTKIASIQPYDEFVVKILHQIATAIYSNKETSIDKTQLPSIPKFGWHLSHVYGTSFEWLVDIEMKFDNHGDPIGFIGTVRYENKYSTPEKFECGLSENELTDKLKYLYSFDHREELQTIKENKEKNEIIVNGIGIFFLAFLVSAIVSGIGGGIVSVMQSMPFLDGIKIGVFLISPIISSLLAYAFTQNELKKKGLK